jgi:DNA repair protein RadA/Sms
LVEDVEGPEPDVATLVAMESGAAAMPIAEVDTVVAGPSRRASPSSIEFWAAVSCRQRHLARRRTGHRQEHAAVAAGGRLAGTHPYVSGEESARQVRLRAERLGATGPNLWLLAETSLPRIVAAFDTVEPQLVVVDSIQSIADPQLGSAPGQRRAGSRLCPPPGFRGQAAWPAGDLWSDTSRRTAPWPGHDLLEHVVDTVLGFEGDRHHALRLLRAVKHRFGPTNELGVFEMVERGLVGVPTQAVCSSPTAAPESAGSAVTPTLDGHRPCWSRFKRSPTRSTRVPAEAQCTGHRSGRLALSARGARAARQVADDATRSVRLAVGGVRLTEPGSDLPMCLAIVSALIDRPVGPDVISFGEVGLAGRTASGLPGHAAPGRGGTARVSLARSSPPTRQTGRGHLLVRVSTLSEALNVAGLGLAVPSRIPP